MLFAQFQSKRAFQPCILFPGGEHIFVFSSPENSSLPGNETFCDSLLETIPVSRYLTNTYWLGTACFLTDGVGDADRECAAIKTVSQRVEGVRGLPRLRDEEADVVPARRGEGKNYYYCKTLLGNMDRWTLEASLLVTICSHQGCFSQTETSSAYYPS